MIVASSDFSHYVSPEKGYALDTKVINEIINLNSDAVYSIIRNEQISVCGYGPIMTLIEYSKLLSHHIKVDVLKRGNSAKNGQSNEVVDYNSVLFYM